MSEERASSLAPLPKPRLRSSLAAAMLWLGPKALSSPSMTLIRKRQTEAPSSVESLIFFARAMSKVDSREEPESDLGRDGSGGLSRMKSMASSRSATADLQLQPYLVRSLAASSLWHILKPSRSSPFRVRGRPCMTSTRKSMMESPLSVLAWILFARFMDNSI